MTFDEALEVLANSENNKLVKEGQLEYGLYRAYDVVCVLQNLKQEYAPTVEMTKDKFNQLNGLVHTVGEEFEPDELPDDGSVRITDKMIELEDGFVLLKDLNVIIHPETLKIIDEED